MKSFTSKTQKIGELGEKICEEFLIKENFSIVEKNYTKQHGEIDIIAIKNNILHFIEVKSIIMKPVSYETYNPGENLTKKKFEKIKKTATQFLNETRVSYETFCIDLYLIYIDKKNKKHKLKRIQNITEVF